MQAAAPIVEARSPERTSRDASLPASSLARLLDENIATVKIASMRAAEELADALGANIEMPLRTSLLLAIYRIPDALLRDAIRSSLMLQWFLDLDDERLADPELNSLIHDCRELLRSGAVSCFFAAVGRMLVQDRVLPRASVSLRG